MTDVPVHEEDRTDWIDRIVRAGLVLLVFIVPLVFTPPAFKWSSEPFKWATAEVAGPLKIACAQTIIFVLCFLWLAKMNARRTLVFRPTALFWALLVYLVAQALSLVKAVNVGYGWFELRIFLFWFLAYLLVTHHAEERDILKMFSAIVLVGALVSIYGLAQCYGKDFVNWGISELSFDELSSIERVRLGQYTEVLREGPSTFGHNNFAAHFLIFGIPIAGAMLFISKKWPSRVFCGAALVLMIWYLNMTRCRGAVVGLGVGVVVCVWLILSRAVSASRADGPEGTTIRQAVGVRLAFTIVIVIAGLVAGLLLMSKGIGVLDQFRRGVDTPYVGRINTWQSSFRAVLESPVLGAGKGSFEDVVPVYWTEYEKNVYARDLKFSKQAHNEYLEIGVETGIIGLGAFGWFLMCLASRSLSVWRKELSVARRAILLSAVCALTGVLVHSVFSFNLQTPASALSFFVLVGVIDVLGFEKAPRLIPLPAGAGSGVRKAVWAALAVSLLLVPPSIARPFLTEMRVARASLARARRDTEEAIRQFESAVRWAPWDTVTRYRLGNAYVAASQWDKASTAYEACLAASPNYVIAWANLGLAHFNLGNQEKAIEAAERALSLAPELAMGHNVLGLAYAKQGRWEEAREEMKRATGLPESGRAQLHKNMAVCHIKLGQLEEAATEFQRATDEARHPDPELYVETGKVLSELERYEEAAESFKKALSLFEARKEAPSSNRLMQQAYYFLAKICLEELDNPYLCSWCVIQLSRAAPEDPALRKITEALYVDLARRGFSFEGAGAAWYHVGAALIRQERYDRAEECLRTLIDRGGESDIKLLRVAYRELAIAIFKLKDYDRALEVVDEGKKIAPDFTPLDNLRGVILSEQALVDGADRKPSE